MIVQRLGGDVDMARELVSLFIAEYPKMAAAVRESVDAGNADAVRRAAHALKGSVSNFLDDGPRLTALALEQAGVDGRVGEWRPLLTQLEAEMAEVLADMRAYEAA